MTFSSRYGYRGQPTEIVVREDAPDDLRAAIPQIAKVAGMTPHQIREVICEVLLKRPDPSNWSAYPNVWEEANRLIEDCLWYRVYDIAEGLYRYLLMHDPQEALPFEERINQFFAENGIGWKMEGGQVTYRGSETFGDATAGAVEALHQTGHQTAANEVHEALRDISRRPHPDITGAIQHVIAALECAARDVTGQPNATLGQLVPALDLPKPLDQAATKLWGFASDRARHVREGQSASTEEAELVVSVACALCTFLSRRQATGSGSAGGLF